MWIIPNLFAVVCFVGTAAEAQAYPLPPPPHPHLGPAYYAPIFPATKTLVLNVENPACCGDYACVKVCVPGCCEGPPKVCARCGVLRRGIVTYEWCCGHRVTVVFTAMGTVRVR